jgi:hypothetical protein
VAKTIKECVEVVKKNREKGAVEEKESEAMEKNQHPTESSHNVNVEEHGKTMAEEPSDPSQNHGRSAVASQSNKLQGQSIHQQPQSTQQVQSQQQQRNEPESQEVRSRQNSTNEELAAQQARVTVSNEAGTMADFVMK